jgi:regulator of sigma E protease
MGVNATLSLLALLSLNLAILNVLPIPALDGGRLFFIVYEAVFRRKISPRAEGYAHAVGMVLLLALIALITFHDIVRIATGGSLLPK